MDGENDRLCSQLGATSAALQQEALQRRHHESSCLQLAIERQRLARALQVEQMIKYVIARGG